MAFRLARLGLGLLHQLLGLFGTLLGQVHAALHGPQFLLHLQGALLSSRQFGLQFGFVVSQRLQLRPAGTDLFH